MKRGTQNPRSAATNARSGDNVGLDQVLYRNDVELDAFESGIHGRIDSREHTREIVAAGNLFEPLAIEGIEMNIQAAKTGVVQRLCVLREQDGVGGQCEVEDPRYGGKALDQARQIAAEQRFAAGETQIYLTPSVTTDAREVFRRFPRR